MNLNKIIAWDVEQTTRQIHALREWLVLNYGHLQHEHRAQVEAEICKLEIILENLRSIAE